MTGSMRAYARHRKEKGLSGGTLTAVQKALAHRRITKGADGKIDFERADREWEENLNQRKRNTSHQEATTHPVVTDGEPGVIPTESFLEAQRQHEWVKKMRADLELQARRGELLEKADVEKAWGEMLTAFRNRMLLMVDKLAPRVAVVSDVLACRAVIEREIKDALLALSEYQSDAA